MYSNNHIICNTFDNINVIYLSKDILLDIYHQYFVIIYQDNDNICIPEYLIEFIKNLFIYDNSIYTERLYTAHYYVIFDTIRKIKIYLKEMAKNPQCAEDTKAQLEFLVNKNKDFLLFNKKYKFCSMVNSSKPQEIANKINNLVINKKKYRIYYFNYFIF